MWDLIENQHREYDRTIGELVVDLELEDLPPVTEDMPKDTWLVLSALYHLLEKEQLAQAS